MKKITNIIVHDSDSIFGNVNTIRCWHKERGWKDIGYHFVILNGHLVPDFKLDSLDGAIECGRPLDGDSFIEENEVGAHALGYNETSIGICIIGKKINGKESFTFKQIESILRFLKELMQRFGLSKEAVLGHYETEQGKAQGKTCPDLDMDKLRALL